MSVIYGNPIIAGGGGLELVANVVDGATVTATLGSKTVTGVSVGGQARLKIPQEGKWTVSATNGTMVSAPQEVSVPATVDLALPSHVLNDTSWAIIKQMSDAGEGANFWAVGDCKEVTMNGKVSDGLTLTNYTTWVFIIGFNHNAEREGNGIAFQGFKATKNGKDVCLIDRFFNSSVPSGSIALRMNDSRTTVGGWKSCKMRTIPLLDKDTHAFRSFCAGEMASEEARSGRQAGACQRGAQSWTVFISAKAVSALAKRRYIHHRGGKNSFSRRFA